MLGNKNFFTNRTTIDEICAKCEEMAINTSLDKRGDVSFSVNAIVRILKQEQRRLSKKVLRGLALYDYEMWIKDNYIQLMNAAVTLQKRYCDLINLPKKKGIPRIFNLVCYICEHLDGRVERDTIALAVNAFNRFSPLNNNEL